MARGGGPRVDQSLEMTADGDTLRRLSSGGDHQRAFCHLPQTTSCSLLEWAAFWDGSRRLPTAVLRCPKIPKSGQTRYNVHLLVLAARASDQSAIQPLKVSAWRYILRVVPVGWDSREQKIAWRVCLKESGCLRCVKAKPGLERFPWTMESGQEV